MGRRVTGMDEKHRKRGRPRKRWMGWEREDLHEEERTRNEVQTGMEWTKRLEKVSTMQRGRKRC